MSSNLFKPFWIRSAWRRACRRFLRLIETSLFPLGADPGFQSFFMVPPASGYSVLLLIDSDNRLDLIDIARTPGL